MSLISFPVEEILNPCSHIAPLSHQTSCNPTTSNLNLPNSFGTALKDPAL